MKPSGAEETGHTDEKATGTRRHQWARETGRCWDATTQVTQWEGLRGQDEGPLESSIPRIQTDGETSSGAVFPHRKKELL